MITCVSLTLTTRSDIYVARPRVDERSISHLASSQLALIYAYSLMHLVARIYFFSVLCLASLATPLSQEGFPKRDLLGKRRHPEADSVTVSAEISALLDDLTHNAIEVRPSPDLRFGLFALTHPQTPSSTGSTKPTSVAPQDRLINPKVYLADCMN
jgi:hypothetical protein